MGQLNRNGRLPVDLGQATTYCFIHGRRARNLSVERIADAPGVETRAANLYKWAQNGRMPANKILPFERACGVDYLTRYLAHGHNKLLVPVPSGRKAQSLELNALSVETHETLALILRFYAGDADAHDVTEAIVLLMEGLAYHCRNIEMYQAPELGLEEQ